MQWLRLSVVFVVSCAVGFALARGFNLAPPSVKQTTPAPEALAQSFRQIIPLNEQVLVDFFTHPKGKGIIYIYRSDCRDCERQWQELALLSGNLPLLAISADDSRFQFATSLAVREKVMPFKPYFVPAARVLGLRSWLGERGCKHTGPLPFIALTNGKGACTMSWRGFTSHTAIEGVANYTVSSSGK